MRKTKVLSALLAGVMTFSAFGMGTTSYAASKSSSKEGKVLNIYCMDEELKGIYEEYAADIGKDAGVKVNFVVIPTENEEYQRTLDYVLANSEKFKDEYRIDAFLVEADYAKKYAESKYVLPVSKLGIKTADLKDQYTYTKDIIKNGSKIMGVSWNICPGVFAYRRSIAKKVLGTDEPEKVQKYVESWTKFDETAAKMSKSGYYMLSNYDGAFRAYAQNSKTPWVKNNTITVSTSINDWVASTKKYADAGYNMMNGAWDSENYKQMGGDGKTFGFFYSGWGVDYTIGDHAKKTTAYRDYAICEGPAAYHWGGTWLCAASCTDNKDTIGKIMKRLTCDPDTMYKIGVENAQCVNSKTAMKKLAATKTIGSELLGGQNPFTVYNNAALKVSVKNITVYDTFLNEVFVDTMLDYIRGTSEQSDALDQFYEAVKEKYPKLKK